VTAPPTGATRPGSAAGGYRPALDGVRGLSVLAIIAYHLGAGPPGEFLAVDVFFVLSGYLITTLLVREVAATGRVRLGEFWARRARRLLPALLLLVFVVAAYTAKREMLSALPARRGDLLATLFYFANWHFIATGQSYFAQFTGVSPLRHMWTLAIEEQFYLVWPMALALIAAVCGRRPRVVLWVAVGGAIGSAVLMALLYDRADPSRSYYGTDTRAQALLVGAALAAILALHPRLLAGRGGGRAGSGVLAAAVAGIGVFLVAMHEQDRLYYHGGAAAFAVATAIFLWGLEARPRGAIARALSVGPVRWVGLISYSVYLWHWPLIVWVGSSDRLHSAAARDVVSVAGTFVAAAATYYLVERPVRTGRVPGLGLSKLRLAFVVPVAVAAAAGAALAATAAASYDFSDTPCPAGSPQVGSLSWCVRVASSPAPSMTIATVGDSTARALDPGLVKVARERRWRYVQAAQGGCSAMGLAFVDPDSLPGAELCARLVPQVQAQDGRLIAATDQQWRRIVEAALLGTLRRLTATGARVIMVKTLPRGEPAECAAGAGSGCRQAAYSTAAPKTAAGDAVLAAAASRLPGRVFLVSIDDVLCPGGPCPAKIDGLLARFDGLHYTATFSRRIVPIILARAEAAGLPLPGG
jgi:peptidoglycan/LPS O-acetylase OafA/YrhL